MNEQKIAELSAKVMMERDEASRHFGMELLSVAPGEARMRMTVVDWMLNGHKNCHGGMIFSLADSTFGVACNSYNKQVVAKIASVTYIAPAYLGDVLMATGRELTRYGRNGIYDIAVHNQHDVLVAEFRGHSRELSGEHIANIHEKISPSE